MLNPAHPDEALLQQHKLSLLEKPTKYKVDLFRDWREHPKLGGRPIKSDDCHAWSEVHGNDLVTATDNKFRYDSTSTWIAGKLLPYYRRTRPRWIGTPSREPQTYSDWKIMRAVNIFATVVSCLFSVLPIVALKCRPDHLDPRRLDGGLHRGVLPLSRRHDRGHLSSCHLPENTYSGLISLPTWDVCTYNLFLVPDLLRFKSSSSVRRATCS